MQRPRQSSPTWMLWVVSPMGEVVTAIAAAAMCVSFLALGLRWDNQYLVVAMSFLLGVLALHSLRRWAPTSHP